MNLITPVFFRESAHYPLIRQTYYSHLIMADISPRMQEYYDRLNAGLAQAMEVAKTARKTGLDPETVVEIPIANDLADRVEAQVGIPRCGPDDP
jgi:DNA polymerase II large subunit DP2.